MNNFWFGDTQIKEQEVVIRDASGDEFAVSLSIGVVEIVLTKREMLKCIETLEFEESFLNKP